MKKLSISVLFPILIVLSLVGKVSADSKMKVLGQVDLLVTSSSKSLPSIPALATKATIGIQGGAVRWKGYSTAPERNNGAYLGSGDYVILDTRSKIDNFRVILDTGSSAVTAYVVYEGVP
ncbi:hypothetical protein LCGC14_1500790 [marine sediment metagenome]|uniref:Uncharacterized protein n=1 Tax=marine sediment metagenome TaxID=412755 RepID=A0A0F9J4M5_9ZZZZ